MDDTNFVSVCREIISVVESPTGIITDSDNWIKLDYLFFWNLARGYESEILEALSMDENYSLPFYMRIEMYQRLILINDSNDKIFREFANYLRMFSNNWNYLAEYFEKVAARLEARK